MLLLRTSWLLLHFNATQWRKDSEWNQRRQTSEEGRRRRLTHTEVNVQKGGDAFLHKVAECVRFFFSSWSRNKLSGLFLHSQVWAELCDCRAIGSVEALRLPTFPRNTSCKTFYYGFYHGIRWNFDLQPCLKSRLQFSRKKILSLHTDVCQISINQSINQATNQSLKVQSETLRGIFCYEVEHNNPPFVEACSLISL